MQFERHAQQVQLEESPEADSRHSPWGHMRFLGLAALLLVANVVTLTLLYVQLLQTGPTVVLLFLFEVAVLSLALLLCVYRYILFTVAQRVERSTGVEWHNHSLYLMVGKLLVNTTKLMVLAGYFGALLTYYGMPFLMVRDLWRAFDAVVRDVSNLSATIKLRAEVSQRFFAPSQEEIDANGELDPIFHTPLTPDTALKLPCGHILNQAGLMSWWEQQRNCPLCRYNIMQADPPAYVRERRRRRQGLPPAPVEEPAAPTPVPAPPAEQAPAARVAAEEPMPAAVQAAGEDTSVSSRRRRRDNSGASVDAAAGERASPSPQAEQPDLSPDPKARSKKKSKSSKSKHRSSRRSPASQSPLVYPQHAPPYWPAPPGQPHSAMHSPWMAPPMHPHSPWTPPAAQHPQMAPGPYGWAPPPHGYSWPAGSPSTGHPYAHSAPASSAYMPPHYEVASPQHGFPQHPPHQLQPATPPPGFYFAMGPGGQVVLAPLPLAAPQLQQHTPAPETAGQHGKASLGAAVSPHSLPFASAASPDAGAASAALVAPAASAAGQAAVSPPPAPAALQLQSSFSELLQQYSSWVKEEVGAQGAPGSPAPEPPQNAAQLPPSSVSTTPTTQVEAATLPASSMPQLRIGASLSPPAAAAAAGVTTAASPAQSISALQPTPSSVSPSTSLVSEAAGSVTKTGAAPPAAPMDVTATLRAAHEERMARQRRAAALSLAAEQEAAVAVVPAAEEFGSISPEGSPAAHSPESFARSDSEDL